MLRQMQQSGATAQQISTAMTNMQQQMSTANALTKVEDNVDTLLQKLEGQGKKVKILTEEEEERAHQERDIKEREMKQKMEEII